MTPFTQSQRVKALFWLSLFHLLVIISSNYLVQLPITIFGFHTTWARLVFLLFFLPPILPCVFLAHRWRAALSSPS